MSGLGPEVLASRHTSHEDVAQLEQTGSLAGCKGRNRLHCQGTGTGDPWAWLPLTTAAREPHP